MLLKSLLFALFAFEVSGITQRLSLDSFLYAPFHKTYEDNVFVYVSSSSNTSLLELIVISDGKGTTTTAAELALATDEYTGLKTPFVTEDKTLKIECDLDDDDNLLLEGWIFLNIGDDVPVYEAIKPLSDNVTTYEATIEEGETAMFITPPHACQLDDSNLVQKYPDYAMSFDVYQPYPDGLEFEIYAMGVDSDDDTNVFERKEADSKKHMDTLYLPTPAVYFKTISQNLTLDFSCDYKNGIENVYPWGAQGLIMTPNFPGMFYDLLFIAPLMITTMHLDFQLQYRKDANSNGFVNIQPVVASRNATAPVYVFSEDCTEKFSGEGDYFTVFGNDGFAMALQYSTSFMSPLPTSKKPITIRSQTTTSQPPSTTTTRSHRTPKTESPAPVITTNASAKPTTSGIGTTPAAPSPCTSEPMTTTTHEPTTTSVSAPGNVTIVFVLALLCYFL